jgi:SAM-dependent methyltransferase
VSKKERPGADAHYRDGRYYDHAYRTYRPDIEHYVALAVQSRGPVLELGVGTGRVAIAIAERSIDIVGVDRMDAMIDRMRERLAKKPRAIASRIELVQGDLRTIDLGRRFPLVIAPFNVFMHLYDLADIEAGLTTAHKHLEPGGILSFDVLMPDFVSLRRDPGRLFKSRPIKHPKDGRRYAYEEAFRYDHSGQVQTVSMIFTDLEDGENKFVTPLAQRQFFPQELRALVHYNGFDLVRFDGGFRSEPIDEYSQSQVIVARKR